MVEYSFEENRNSYVIVPKDTTVLSVGTQFIQRGTDRHHRFISNGVGHKDASERSEKCP